MLTLGLSVLVGLLAALARCGSITAAAKQVGLSYKAAWDAIGSEFGSRHTQYEMFYAGARFVTTGHSFRTFDWDNATGLVDALLSSYDLGGELQPARN